MRKRGECVNTMKYGRCRDEVVVDRMRRKKAIVVEYHFIVKRFGSLGAGFEPASSTFHHIIAIRFFTGWRISG